MLPKQKKCLSGSSSCQESQTFCCRKYGLPKPKLRTKVNKLRSVRRPKKQCLSLQQIRVKKTNKNKSYIVVLIVKCQILLPSNGLSFPQNFLHDSVETSRKNHIFQVNFLDL